MANEKCPMIYGKLNGPHLEFTRAFSVIQGLLPLPAHAVLRVFEDNTEIGELLANLVSSTKVAPPTSLLPPVDQRLNLRIEHLPLLFTKNIQHRIDAGN